MTTGRNVVGKAATGPARSHTARVVDDLGLAIVSGRLEQGVLLGGDQELLTQFGVSRTVLREAFRILAAKGLVQARARVGTRVRPRSGWNLFDSEVLRWHEETGLTPDFLKHLAEVRMALEPEAAALAAQRRTDKDVKTIRQWADKMDRVGISTEDFARADLAFHLAVAEAADNPFFVSISALIEVILIAMLRSSSPADDAQRLQDSVSQHRRIADAIARKNPDAARDEMRAVIQTGINNAKAHRLLG
jgi:DNA-binding FadR family transcriptional regulator